MGPILHLDHFFMSVFQLIISIQLSNLLLISFSLLSRFDCYLLFCLLLLFCCITRFEIFDYESVFLVTLLMGTLSRPGLKVGLHLLLSGIQGHYQWINLQLVVYVAVGPSRNYENKLGD